MYATMVFMAALATANPQALDTAIGAPQHSCGTRAFFEESLANVQPVLPIFMAGDEKILRDPFGDFTGVRSENFVLKWGSEAYAPSASQQEEILAVLEETWLNLVDNLGVTAPTGTDSYLLNVYIAGSGNNAPEHIEYAAAYVTVDHEGYPFIAINPDIRSQGVAPYVATLAHEFFHTVQFSSPARERWTAPNYWFWEASAEWAAGTVYPSNSGGFDNIPFYLMLPEVPLEFADFADSGSFIERHHYGAGHFVRHLSENVAEPQLIRDAWLEGGFNESPLMTLGRLVQERGMDIRKIFASFAAKNTVYDYELGYQYKQMTDMTANYNRKSDHRITATIGSGGMKDYSDIPYKLLPGRFAYNVLTLEDPKHEYLDIRVRADEKGSEGGFSHLNATLVRHLGATYEYQDLGRISVEGSQFKAELTGDELEVHLVISSVPAWGWQQDETYPYHYQIRRALDPSELEEEGEGPGDKVDTDGDDTGVFGCSLQTPSVAGRGLLASACFMLLGFCLIVRRRRA